MMSKTIRAKNPREFLDLVPISGVFEMTDCEVEIFYPETATTEELQYITQVLESMIHVVDIRVTQSPELDLNDKEKFKVVIDEAGPNRPKYMRRSR